MRMSECRKFVGIREFFQNQTFTKCKCYIKKNKKKKKFNYVRGKK